MTAETAEMNRRTAIGVAVSTLALAFFPGCSGMRTSAALNSGPKVSPACGLSESELADWELETEKVLNYAREEGHVVSGRGLDALQDVLLHHDHSARVLEFAAYQVGRYGGKDALALLQRVLVNDGGSQDRWAEYGYSTRLNLAWCVTGQFCQLLKGETLSPRDKQLGLKALNYIQNSSEYSEATREGVRSGLDNYL